MLIEQVSAAWPPAQTAIMYWPGVIDGIASDAVPTPPGNRVATRVTGTPAGPSYTEQVEKSLTPVVVRIVIDAGYQTFPAPAGPTDKVAVPVPLMIPWACPPVSGTEVIRCRYTCNGRRRIGRATGPHASMSGAHAPAGECNPAGTLTVSVSTVS